MPIFLPAQPASVRKRSREDWRNRCSVSRPRTASSDTTKRVRPVRSFAAKARTIPIFSSTREFSKSAIPTRRAGFYESDQLSSRDLIHQFSMQSYSGGMRVLLLSDVDFATHEAANALLKFLEEPPRGVVMILTTATPGRLLSTIRSRAIEVRFSLLASSEVREVLGRLGYGRDDAERAASLSGGSVTRAVSTLEGEEESLRAHVVRWFFESVAGDSPRDSWATRETLDDGLETIKIAGARLDRGERPGRASRWSR